MVLWIRDYHQDCTSANGSQSDEVPVFFDFEAEERWRKKNASPIKTAKKPGKILEFKRKN